MQSLKEQKQSTTIHMVFVNEKNSYPLKREQVPLTLENQESSGGCRPVGTKRGESDDLPQKDQLTVFQPGYRLYPPHIEYCFQLHSFEIGIESGSFWQQPKIPSFGLNACLLNPN